jgi:HEAT repeat protein
MGPAAVQPIAEHLATASGGNAAAALEVAVALRDARLLDAGFRLLGDGLPIVRRRAVELLGALGGERAAASITAALEDPAAEVRAAAATALGRGNHRAAAARLAAALRDSSWDVRRAAGMSLRQLGAPGELLLERMVADTDRFAGDMARLMIELPRAV